MDGSRGLQYSTVEFLVSSSVLLLKCFTYLVECVMLCSVRVCLAHILQLRNDRRTACLCSTSN